MPEDDQQSSRGAAVPFADLEFYKSLGMKSGLEIHRQLDTERKLFCKCPAVRTYSDHFDAELLRHMRPTLSELGEYDPTALMEFKTKKEIIYRLARDTVCTYEMDDAPPFGLNRDALDRALVLGVMLNLSLVDELHIARKQYLDGSIPTGFQRTTIVGVDGFLMCRGRRIGVRQLGLEEDACREVSDKGHLRTYMTDRLSIPLIEVVTEADMRTPAEVAFVAGVIQRLCHLSGVVRTGLGKVRQDVNVSIAGGSRVEIKGVPRIRQIPALVHWEALRQRALLEVRDLCKARGLDAGAFAEDLDVTEHARRFSHPLFAGISRGGKAHAVVLRNAAGILAYPTGPRRTFGHEVSDRLRVVACVDRMPNLAHSDDPDCFGLSGLFEAVRRQTGATCGDAVVVTAGPGRDMPTAVGEIRLRLCEALSGVPRETRKALPGGATCFERLLPGPDRMYPDTDLPPIVLGQADFERARGRAPGALWDKEAGYAAAGLSVEQTERLMTTDRFRLFDAAAPRVRLRASVLAYLLLDWLTALSRAGIDTRPADADLLARLFGGEDAGTMRQRDAAAALSAALGHVPGWVGKAGGKGQAQGQGQAGTGSGTGAGARVTSGVDPVEVRT
ncbi:MAG: Glu-tRNA(Gln) amidotransferase subunit GatE [Deltaproteobacteria bacterium]|nr:Glu-tRNA(Gln) amidotransferase subunit GatE [Deltaproteobacteria bacterium]